MAVLPFSLDPLIAEAKRRMRRRRLATAAVVLLVSGGVVGGGAALRSQSAAPGSALTPASSNLPPLSNLAARAFWCGDAGNASGHGGCHSPDGKWSVVVGGSGKGCTLTVTRIGTGRHWRIVQPDSWGCVNLLWVGHRFVVQEGYDQPKHRVISIDPPSRHVTVLARFRNFVVSPNERWIAGEAAVRRDGTPQLVAVRSLTGNTCRVVTQATSPHQGVSVYQSPWSRQPVIPTGKPFQNPVVWRTIRRDGRKIRVATGPGTGFTRDSRSVIVAKWENGKRPSYTPTHKRLLKFDLSSLRTPCPLGLAPHS